MKIVKVSLILVAAVAAIVGLSTASYAFHSGGVAECMGCHNIHDGQSASALLMAGDITSTCANANCHGNTAAGSYHVLTPSVTSGVPPTQITPGGDFGWLLKTYTWDNRGGNTELGERHGHNVVATAIPGFVVDAHNGTAPGGDMDANLLSCNSCHDNHGKLRRLSGTGGFALTGAPIIGSGSYTNSTIPVSGTAVGVYRILRGTGSSAGSGGKTFTSVFNAIVASNYNRSEAATQTAVAYGNGVTDWCASCHPDMHSGSSSKLTHPVDQGFSGGTTGVAANYNSYLGSGLIGASGFDTIVPFQTDNTSDMAALQAAANTVNAQAATSSRVMCLSCHRAHASGFAHMTRWQNENEFIAVDGVWPGTDSPSSIATAAKYAMGRTVAETTASYNYKPETKYSSYQRSLCNKCHAKD